MNTVITTMPKHEQHRAEYNLHLSSFDSTFLAKMSRSDHISCLRLLTKFGLCLLLSMTKNSSKSAPSCFFLVTKQSSSIMAALIIVKGKQTTAKTIGKIMACHRSVLSVLKLASILGREPRLRSWLGMFIVMSTNPVSTFKSLEGTLTLIDGLVIVIPRNSLGTLCNMV